MARPPRLELAGVPMHVIQRGNNRAACFFGDVDRRFYLKCLQEAAARRGCDVHAYVLMTNHVHLLATPRERGALAGVMQDVGRKFVRVFNTIHGRTGTLWEGRFRASLVDSESYLLACHRYIELNPVRAGVVRSADDYEWSSHAHYAHGRTDKLITEHASFKGLGSTPSERQAAYRALFRQGLDVVTVETIRRAANTDTAVGSEQFLRETEIRLGRSVRPPRRGRPPKEITSKLL